MKPPSCHFLTGLCLLAFATASLRGEDPLPVVAAEIIDQGSSYQNSGGGPVGDEHPEIGTGIRLAKGSGSEEMVLDFRGNSLVADLGQVQKVSSLKLHPGKHPVQDVFGNLKGNLEVYYSLDNRTFRKIESFTETLDKGDEPALWLSGFDVLARYVKVHAKYLGDSYRIVGGAKRLLEAFGESGPPAGDRASVDFGLLQSGDNVVRVNTRLFETGSQPGFRFKLWPYIREPHTKPLAEGAITFTGGGGGHWKNAILKIGSVSPGFYGLTVESADSEVVFWSEDFDLHLVSKVHRWTLAEDTPLPPLVGGEALVVTPGLGTPPQGWDIDRRNPLWPLWVCKTNRIARLNIPVPLASQTAIYLGTLGNVSATISTGQETLLPQSSAGHSENWINETFFGLANDPLVIRSKISPKPLKIAYLKALALTPEQAAVAQGKASAFAGKKFIFYCDGYSIHGGFRQPSHFSAKDFEKYADEFRDSSDIVERFDYSQGTSSTIISHLSKVPTTEYPGQNGFYHTKYSEFVTQNFKENYIAKGLNPIEVMGRRLQTHNVPIYAGYRMNAWYDAPMDLHYVSSYWREHPKFRIQPYRGTVWAPRSYAYAEVRTLNLEVMREMLGLGIQGIHLEFLRHPPFVGFDEPLIKSFKEKYGKSPLEPNFDLWPEWRTAQTEVLTSFVREVRNLLDEEGKKHGRHFGLTVRFDFRNFREQALDVEHWAKEGLVDALIPGDYSIRNHPINLAPFQKMTESTPVKIYSSLSPEESGTRDPTPEDDERGVPPPGGKIPVKDLKSFVADAFRQGAAGIYMFNNGGVGRDQDWRQFRGLERWDIYENPYHLSRFRYSHP